MTPLLNLDAETAEFGSENEELYSFGSLLSEVFSALSFQVLLVYQIFFFIILMVTCIFRGDMVEP